MALADLLATMEQEARTRAAEIRSAAEAEAAGIVQEAETRIAARQSSDLGTRQDRLRWESGRELAAERRRARAEILLLRERLLERIREAVVERLPELTQRKDYRERLPELLASGFAQLGSGAPIRLRAGPPLATVLADLAGKRARVVPDSAVVAGFLLETEDGSRRIDHRLDERLSARWPHIAIALASAIGGGGP